MRFLFASLLLSAAASTADAAAILTSSNQFAQAEAWWRSGATTNGNFGLTQDFTGANFAAVEDRSFSFGGFSGRGFAQHGATFTPANPLIGGAFSSVVMDACTSAEIFTPDASNSEDRAYGLASGVIAFDLLTAHSWTWIGAWQGQTFNTGAYHEVAAEISLIDTNTGIPVVLDTRSSVNGVGDWSDPIFYAGVLGPGSYEIAWSHESVVGNGVTPWGFFGVTAGGAPLISCVNSTFTLTPIPAPATIVIFGVGLALGATRRR